MSSRVSLLQDFEQIRLDLIKEYDSKGMRASGKFADSLEVFEDNEGIGIKGLMYGQQLETGRRPNNGSSGESWNTAIQDIEQWIQDKGIQAVDISVSSLAYLIALKIWREGWDRKGYGGVELISSVITDKRIQDILDKYEIEKTTEIVTDIIRLTKETLA